MSIDPIELECGSLRRSRRNAIRCAYCGALAWYVCDADRAAAGAGSCNRAICGRCRVLTAEGLDLCREHPAPAADLCELTPAA